LGEGLEEAFSNSSSVGFLLGSGADVEGVITGLPELTAVGFGVAAVFAPGGVGILPAN